MARPESTVEVCRSPSLRRSWGLPIERIVRHPLSETFLIDFVGAGERQLLKEKDAARMLVGGAVGQSELLEIFFCRSRTRAQDDESVRHLAFHVVIEWHDQRLMNGGMALKQRLDLY